MDFLQALEIFKCSVWDLRNTVIYDKRCDLFSPFLAGPMIKSVFEVMYKKLILFNGLA